MIAVFPSTNDSAPPWRAENPSAISPIGGNPQRTGGRTHPGPSFMPTWRWVPPPGIGDALQHVWSTLELIPFSLDGAGDRPASYLSIGTAPLLLNFAVRQHGIPVSGGDILLTGLYTPLPMQSPSNRVYPGAGI